MRCEGEMGVGGGADGMDSVSSFAGRWLGLEGLEVGVRASSSQESGGGAGVLVGFRERVLRVDGRSIIE